MRRRIWLFGLVFILLAGLASATVYYFIAPEPNCRYGETVAHPEVLVLHETGALLEGGDADTFKELKNVVYKNKDDKHTINLIVDWSTSAALNRFSSPQGKAATHMVVSRVGDIFLAMNSQREVLLYNKTRCIHSNWNSPFFGVEFASTGSITESQKAVIPAVILTFNYAGVSKYITHTQTKIGRGSSIKGDGGSVWLELEMLNYPGLVQDSEISKLKSEVDTTASGNAVATSNQATATPGQASAKVVTQPTSSTQQASSAVKNMLSSGIFCLNSQRCKELDEVWNLLGKVIRGSSLIWDPSVLPPQWRSFQETSPSVNFETAAGGACPSNMANIEGKYCIDKWEAIVVDKNTGQEASPNYIPIRTGTINAEWQYNLFKGMSAPAQYSMPQRGAEKEASFEPKAVSVSGVTPASFVTRAVAELACQNAGKRLCTEAEWVKACSGSQNQAFPYGSSYQAGKCNVALQSQWPPAVIGRSNTGSDMMDPRIGLVIGADNLIMKRVTGYMSECTNSYGVYDMVGNVHEIVADLSSTGKAIFLGSHYARPGTGQTVESQSCQEATRAHDPVGYSDYSIGFRCCADLTGGSSTSSSTSSLTPSSSSQITIEQKNEAAKLYQKLRFKLNNDNLAKAIVANAYGESKLDYQIAGDCGSYGETNRGSSLNIPGKGQCCSFGLWQYNICGGMGTGYLKEYGSPSTPEEKLMILRDYQKQIDYLVKVLQTRYASQIQEQLTTDNWVEWFVKEIERPAEPSTQIRIRQQIARDLETAGAFT